MSRFYTAWLRFHTHTSETLHKTNRKQTAEIFCLYWILDDIQVMKIHYTSITASEGNLGIPTRTATNNVSVLRSSYTKIYGPGVSINAAYELIEQHSLNPCRTGMYSFSLWCVTFPDSCSESETVRHPYSVPYMLLVGNLAQFRLRPRNVTACTWKLVLRCQGGRVRRHDTITTVVLSIHRWDVLLISMSLHAPIVKKKYRIIKLVQWERK